MDRTSTYGAAAIASGVVGLLVGILTLAWPPAVPVAQWSHPFPVGVAAVVAVVLAVTHLLTAAGFVGVVAADPHGGSRAATVTLWIAVVGFVVLGVAELLSAGIGGQDVDSGTAAAVGSVYGIGSLLTALGGIVAGVVVARRGAWTGAARWALLAGGLVMLLLVTPANAAGAGTVVRTSALVLWSLTFVPLGMALRARTVADTRTEVGSTPGQTSSN